MEVHSNCTGITKAFEIAFDAIKLGRYKNVVVCYSQLSSSFLSASYFNPQRIRKENIFLRWFLSDSASAVILRGRDEVTSGIKVVDVYNESLGGKMSPAMWLYLGCANFNLPKVYEEGGHHLGQNYSCLLYTSPSPRD